MLVCVHSRNVFFGGGDTRGAPDKGERKDYSSPPHPPNVGVAELPERG